MLYHPFSSHPWRAGVALLLLLLFTVACGPAAPRAAGPEIETSRAVAAPAEKAVVREVIREVAAPVAKETLREAVAEAVAAQLQQLTQPGVAVWSAAVTPVDNAGDVVWTRVSGETAAGTINGETGDTDFRLLKIQLTDASKDLTVTTPGPAAAFTDQTLRIGDNFLSFQSNADSATYNSGAKQTVWSFVGDYTDWYKLGVTYPVAVLTPINPANLLPDPMMAATAIPNHLLGYDDEVNQVPLSLLDDRYRRQVPADTPEVFSFPTSPAPAAGDSVTLLHPDAVLQYYTGTIAQARVTLREMEVHLNIPGGSITHVRGFSSNNIATLRGKVFAIITGSPTSRPTWLYYKGMPYSISQSIAPGFPNFYEVSGLGYAQLVVDEKPQYAFTLADGTRRPHDRQYQPDTYTYNGSSWELTPGSVSRWAESDSMDKIPPNKLPAAATQSLHAGPGNGLTINNSSQAARRSSLTQFSPAFDLDDRYKDWGIITVQAKLRLTRRFPKTIGFGQETTAGITLEGMAFASQVKDKPPYSSAADNGIEVGEAVIYEGATTLGTLSLYVAHAANNALGYYLSYAGNSGSRNFAVDMSDLEVGFIPNDKPRSIQGGKLATWTAQTTTPTTGGRKPNWSIESSPPGTGSVQAQPGDLPINRRNRIRVDLYTPTAQCFGWLFIAKTGGTEIARAVVPLSPSGFDSVLTTTTFGGHTGSSYTRLNLGNNQFLLIDYSSTSTGQDRFDIIPHTTGFDPAGNANAWTTWPANLTVELYEAVIN